MTNSASERGDRLHSGSTSCRLLFSWDGGINVPRDCEGNCLDPTLIRDQTSGPHNDGTCHTGSRTNMKWNFFCEDWAYDGADCDPTLIGKRVEPTIECLITPPPGRHERFGETQILSGQLLSFPQRRETGGEVCVVVPGGEEGGGEGSLVVERGGGESGGEGTRRQVVEWGGREWGRERSWKKGCCPCFAIVEQTRKIPDTLPVRENRHVGV